ncbi:MAG: LysE family transporter [Bacteriovoracaceae bacterium]|nr:LysE family transporter [Bacteriovoracaceae bacterium]
MEEVILAATLGLSGGISPGPMLVLVLTQTIQHGFKEGIKVTLGPLVSDAPIIFVAYYFMDLIAISYLDWLYLPGGLYLLYMAKHTWAVDFEGIKKNKASANSIKKGVITNILNPAPYMFWFTIGAPILVKMNSSSQMTLFFVVFYLGLLGTKVLIAYLISIGRSNTKVLERLSKGLSLIIFGYGIYFISAWLEMFGKA